MWWTRRLALWRRNGIVTVTGQRKMESVPRDAQARTLRKYCRGMLSSTRQRGTGDAVLAAKPLLNNYSGIVFRTLYGDTPAQSAPAETLARMVEALKDGKTRAALAVARHGSGNAQTTMAG